MQNKGTFLLNNVQSILSSDFVMVENTKYFNLDQLVEVELFKPTDFLLIAETLTRIGFQQDDCLIQQCYLFSKQGKYFITHINELRKFDGESVKISEDDIGIRNLVANLFAEWKMLVDRDWETNNTAE